MQDDVPKAIAVGLRQLAALFDRNRLSIRARVGQAKQLRTVGIAEPLQNRQQPRALYRLPRKVKEENEKCEGRETEEEWEDTG